MNDKNVAKRKIRWLDMFLYSGTALISLPAVAQLGLILYVIKDELTYKNSEPPDQYDYQTAAFIGLIFLFELFLYVITFLIARFAFKFKQNWRFYGWTLMVGSAVVIFFVLIFVLIIFPLFYFFSGAPFGISRF